jgi:hypothetical protein
MQRTISVRPDQELTLTTGETIPCVSRGAMLEAFEAMEAQLWVAGGAVTVMVERVPTEVPQERVTTFALFTWQDRTSPGGGVDRPQPESDRAVAPAPPVQEANAYLDGAPVALTAEDLEAVLLARATREAPPEPEPARELTAEDMMAALETSLPQPPPQVHPAELSDPDAEDVSAIPEHAR